MRHVDIIDRQAVADRVRNSPAGRLDPAAPILIENGDCPTCGLHVISFRDELSVREYRISGMCQACQDLTFGEDNEEREVPTDPADFV